MRKRTGNFFSEAHGQSLRHYDWVAPVGTLPSAVPTAIEAAIPGLKLYHRGDNQQNGAVYTSLRPDGSLHVSVNLYDTPCADPNCPGAHGPVQISVAPTLTPAQEAAMVAAVGEHVMHRLTGTPADDLVLAALGFGLDDAPRRTT